MISSSRWSPRWFCAAALAVSTLLPLAAVAQQPLSRIAGPVAGAVRSTLVGSHADHARTATDTGRLSGTTPLNGMSLAFARSTAQEAELQTLLAAQQNPASPLYHAWLTPEQFGARFGMSDADLSAAQAWLEQQGFKVDAVARSRNRITFSGTAAQAETAFGTEIHNYRGADGQTHFAPSTDLSLPGSLAAVTHTVTGLSSFKPRPHLRHSSNLGAHYTSSLSGAVHFTPADIRTAYDINPAYNSGFTGAGQTIAVVGESAVYLTDIEHFQSASGLAVKDPTITLVPNTGSSQVYSDDESESDLDLEYSGSIAPGATINFVYAGNNANADVTTAIAYAVDNKIGTIISTSYGECEADLAAGDYTSQNAVLAQAAAQGQTVVSASGDSGSSDCSVTNANTGVVTDTAVAVDFPASSQYVTSMGGTENPAADDVAGNGYWQAQSTSDIISSAITYIPEIVWNDSATTVPEGAGPSAGGGGASTLTARPTWQAGVTGIPAGVTRLVPDLSLPASPDNPGYLYCTSDSTSYAQGQVSSCNSGFRDSSSSDLTIVGGTSVATPIFAGMVALINQATGATTGQGVVNTTLYALAANSSTYASAFHDITSGNNTACPTASSYCTETSATTFAAGVGYDEATGLGSVDLYNLLRAWNTTGTTTSGLLASTTTIAAATTTPASGASDLLTITVAPGSGTGSTVTPTGTLSLVVDGGTASSLTLANGVATYTFSTTTSGAHTVAATYSGDGVYAPSAGTVTLTVPTTTTANSSFTVAATGVTVTAGSSGTSTVTVTPANGYNGTVDWAITSSATLTNACYAIANTVVNSSSPVTTTLTIYTSAQACSSETPLSVKGGRHAFVQAGGSGQARLTGLPGQRSNGEAPRWAMAALGLFGLLGLRARRLRPLAMVLLLAGAGLFVTGCGSGGSGTGVVTTNTATGTYTLTLKGTDSGSSSFTASTNLTLTVQ